MGQRWIEATTVMNAQAIDAGSTSYSNVLAALNMVGAYGAMHITVTATGVLTITQQASLDGANWLDPTNGTMVAVGATYAATYKVLTQYITFTPLVAPYIRFKATPDVSVTMSLKYVAQGEKE